MAGEPKRVLIVEDDLAVRETFRKCFLKLACQVRVAGTEEEARQFLAQEAYDLVLLDVRLLWGGSGTNVLRFLREELQSNTPGFDVD